MLALVCNLTFEHHFPFTKACLSFELFPSKARLSVHVGVVEPSHEGIGADHLLRPDPGAELRVAVAELVHVDRDHVGVVVEADKTLINQTLATLIH